jgi:hypothetical protein
MEQVFIPDMIESSEVHAPTEVTFASLMAEILVDEVL